MILVVHGSIHNTKIIIVLVEITLPYCKNYYTHIFALKDIIIVVNKKTKIIQLTNTTTDQVSIN